MNPYGLFSTSMVRTAKALRRYAPRGVEFVTDRNDPGIDLHVVHVISRDSLRDTEGKPRVLVQYCAVSGGVLLDPPAWVRAWREARMVWSYYDLPAICPEMDTRNFYRSPLGIDKAFLEAAYVPGASRRVGIMTSGYVSGGLAEAIEEATMAAHEVGVTSLHLGPSEVEGMPHAPAGFNPVSGVNDETLARMYCECSYVSGLRHCEGFEMPVIEGLACGARPIVFDRKDMRDWYEGHAVFVPECEGQPLIDSLAEVLRRRPEPVGKAERGAVIEKFDWRRIAEGFWRMAL